MVDPDHGVAVVSHSAWHNFLMAKVEIITLENAGLMEVGAGAGLPFMLIGTFGKILGRQCDLHSTNEYFFSRNSSPM